MCVSVWDFRFKLMFNQIHGSQFGKKKKKKIFTELGFSMETPQTL